MTTNQLTHDLASLKIDRSSAPPPRKSAALKWSVGIVAVVALVFGAVRGYPYVAAKLFKTPVSVTEVALVSPSQAAVNLSASGYVVPQRASKVGAKVSGKIAKLFAREGSVVDAGAIIAELEMADQRALIAASRARAAAESASAETLQAGVTELDQQLTRERELVAAGAMGRATLEDLEARRVGAASAVTAARARARAAELETAAFVTAMDDRVIVAPIAGTLIAKPAEIGESVGPQAGAVAEIADFSSLMVEAEVPEGRLHKVALSAPAEIVLDAYPKRRFRGQVAEIGKTVNRAKATVVVKVRFDDAMDGVLPNMSARVSFLTEALSDEALKSPSKRMVPSNAVVTRSDAAGVFVIENGKVRFVTVTLGESVGSDVELVDGPGPGTRIVSRPPETMKDGQGVKEENG